MKQFYFLCTAILIAISIPAQSLPDSITKKIDSLFTQWDNTNSPGCAIGIVRNDSLIYAKGYGMANLEYAIPNTPATIFNIGSISKQFTAWSILLLERQGKLHLDDDVHKYLSWFPDLKEKITIRNLLNHTSGMREELKLLALSGTDPTGNIITQEHIIKILSKQQALNFKPGEKFSYTNSGYIILAEIVKSVSGLSLRKFTDSAIFKPLGMSNTHVHDDYTEIEKNLAYSYEPLDSDHFKNSICNNAYFGSTGIFTNIEDMSKWAINFYTHKTGDQAIIDSLTKKVKLNNGKELHYANGIIADTYNGWKRYSHGGYEAGYRSNISVFPDLKMGFIIFSNRGDFDPNPLPDDIAGFFIKDTTQKKENVVLFKTDTTDAVLKDSLLIKKFLGNYIDEGGMQTSFDVKNNKLYFHYKDQSNMLIEESKDNFAMLDYLPVKFVFSIQAKDTLFDLKIPDEFEIYKSYRSKKYMPAILPNDEMLQTYTGNYYCPELDCRYGIVLKDNQLVLTNNTYSDTKLTWINKDHFTTDYWWIDNLQMLRDNKNQVIGFEVNSSQMIHLVMHLKFIKLVPPQN